METSDDLKVKTDCMKMVFLNGNSTLRCSLHGLSNLNIGIIGIIWYWRNETSGIDDKVFEFIGGHQKPFRQGAEVSPERLKTGDASLQLPGVQLWEAGEYRCEVTVTPQKAQGTVVLQVVAYPTIRLIPEQVTMSDHEDKYIACESSGFYPEAINITWEKYRWKVPQFQEISEGNFTNSIKNKDGTFNATSYLKLKPSLEDNGTIYQCVVWHISLHNPQRLNFTLPVMTESAKTNFSWIFLLVLLTGIFIVVVVVIVIVFLKRCRSDEQTSNNDTPKEETNGLLQLAQIQPHLQHGSNPSSIQSFTH